MDNIPKIIHIAWKHKHILDSQSPLILNGLRKLIDINPDWQVTIHTDEEIDHYLKVTLQEIDYKLIQDKHVVAKTDIWRLLKLYLEGGLYIDIDRFCNIKLSELATDNIKWVLPTYMDTDFSHDFMMSAPKNPVFLKAIDLYLTRRREGNDNIYFLGPQTYMHAITMVLCGEMINTNPGKEKFDKILATINQAPFIKTYRETPPYDTIIFNDTDTQPDLETLKREFYAREGINHWTGSW